MADEALQLLADALKKAAGYGPVGISSTFIKGASPTLKIPERFDEQLAAAWRLDDAAAGLSLTFKPESVSAVSGGRFRVTDAILTRPFLNAKPEETRVIATFGLIGASPAQMLQVSIEAVLRDWTFTKFFRWMKGFRFDQLKLKTTTFIFSTDAGEYRWCETETILLQAGQNFVATMSVPPSLKPFLALVQGLAEVPVELTISGPVALDKANTATILHPEMDLRARLRSGPQTRVAYLPVQDPRIGFRILSETIQDDSDLATLSLREAPAGTARIIQTPTLYVGVTYKLVPKTGAAILLDFEVECDSAAILYRFSLSPNPESRLTPDAVATLVGGVSYLEFTPPPLQRFLTGVSFKGLMLTGGLSPPSLISAGVVIGSSPGADLMLFKDTTNGQEFKVVSFDLRWTLLSPLARDHRQSLVRFTTTLLLWPDIFRTVRGEPGGKFRVSIDQNFNIDATFNGRLSMDALLKGITNGSIGMPVGVAVDFSDVALSLSPSAKTYAFKFTVDSTIDFIKVGSKPLVRLLGLRFWLSAATPTGKGDKPRTVYQGSIEGTIAVGPVAAHAAIRYDGAARVWTLRAELGHPLTLSELIHQFLDRYELPAFLPGALTVETFAIDATLPAEQKKSSYKLAAGVRTLPAEQKKSSYKLAAGVRWVYKPLELDLLAELGLAYDGDRARPFSGSILGTVKLGAIGLEVQIGYRFGPAVVDMLELGAPQRQALALVDDDSKELWVQWRGARAAYDIANKKLTFSLNGWSVGRIIEELVSTVGRRSFTLPTPWDLLNQIALDGLKLTYDLTPNAKYPLSASYELGAPLNLGFVTIEGLSFKRVDGKITLGIKGSTIIPGLGDSDIFKPEGGDVKKMPSVPGRGSSLFQLNLLMMGQRVGVRGAEGFDSIKDAIAKLQRVPPSDGLENPVDPRSDAPGQPYYRQASNWLLATHFGVLRAGKDYTFDLMLVFADPDLYGLRLAFNGEKAKVLAGLAVEILYKKVTDDVGVYQLDLALPLSIRKFSLGAFTITLPEIRIQIYTNGDFFFDFGFPYDLDFSRSFTLDGIIVVWAVPVPLLGSAGFYFGKLSNTTATEMPLTRKGSFDPVILFGLGLQFGFGKSFKAGPLDAGFSVTVFGIVEGVIAPWHPYEPSSQEPDTLQGSYYFKLAGTFGVQGQLYGTVDLSVVKADVNVGFKVYVQITYESFRAIWISATASIVVKLKVAIDLGLFAIDLDFSFSSAVTVEALLGTDSKAPWDDDALFDRRAERLRRTAELCVLQAPVSLQFRPVAAKTGVDKPALTLTPAVPFTVLTPDENSTSLAEQAGAFVFLLAIDAPTAGGTGNRSGSSFQSLCEGLLPWILDALSEDHPTAEVADLEAVQTKLVDRKKLSAVIDALSRTDPPPFTVAQVMAFLKGAFTLNVKSPRNDDPLKNGATLFPPLPGLSLIVPKPDGTSGTVTIDLGGYVTVDQIYRRGLTTHFGKLAPRGRGDAVVREPADVEPGPKSLAEHTFLDYFLLVGRQLVQAAADALDDFTYVLADRDSVDLIVDWATKRGNVVDPEDVLAPNLGTKLTAGKTLKLAGLRTTVQRDDTLATIAARYSDVQGRWKTTPPQLVLANGASRTVLVPGVEIKLSGKPAYTTRPGDSFAGVAEVVGLTLAQLSERTELHGMKGLLAPLSVVGIPELVYTTTPDGTDTLAAILASFATSLDAVMLSADPAARHNRAVFDLFDRKQSPTIRLARLQKLHVADLWAALLRDDQIAQIAGMAGRYPLHGTRLPRLPGLTMSPGFLYPTTGQTGYGLYQLTGQQVPTPSNAAGYTLTVHKGASLSWLRFEGRPEQEHLSLDLGRPYTALGDLLKYARTQGYRPDMTLAVQEAVHLVPRRIPLREVTLWYSSGEAQLAQLAAAPSTAVGTDPTARPPSLLWMMPEGLMARAADLEARWSGVLPPRQSVPFLPRLQPQVGTTDPASRRTVFTPMKGFAFATRVDFQIKRLAQDADLAPASPFANDVVLRDHGNPGARARPLAPYNYELLGSSPADAILLQRLLTAMASLGEDIVSGLFLLYPNRGAAPDGLVSQGREEFLAFITQTNLSTETNPPRSRFTGGEAEAPLRGIAQRPAEFIKRMWELSTVRSGGYYLYYQRIAGDQGLPDTLFDDSGVATLTLVITYKRTDDAHAALSSHVNALWTTDAVDRGRAVMTLESQSFGAATVAGKGGSTLAQVAAFYGVEPGTVVRQNPTLALVAGAALPVAGVVHQVSPQDLEGGEVFKRLAARYSQGARTPITEQNIVDFNPGVQPALYAAMRIPPLVYVVSDKAAPGATLRSIATYYCLSDGALAGLLLDVDGILPPDRGLVVDTIVHEARPNLGTGNVGVVLTRKDPGDALEETLASLYSLLDAGLSGNAFFEKVSPGPSFGPLQLVGESTPEQLRDPERRRELLAAIDDTDDSRTRRFQRALGIRPPFAKFNAAPVAVDGLPARDENPYIGVGTLAQPSLRFLDLFGNRTVTPFELPARDYTGPLNNPVAPVLYTDELIGLHDWPNVMSSYTYGGSVGNPELCIKLTLQTAAYQKPDDPANPHAQINLLGRADWQETARNHQRVYTRLYFQLNQNYSGLNIPGLAGQAVSIWLINSLLASPEDELHESLAEQLRDFVKKCLLYVTRRANGDEGGPAPAMRLVLAVPPGNVSKENVVRLAVSLVLRRQARLLVPELRGILGAAEVSTIIRPETDQPRSDGLQSIKAFASALENVFQLPTWRLRVGTSATSPSRSRSSEANNIWAVRLGLNSSEGITWNFARTPSFYAPRPLASTLISGTARLRYSTSGEAGPLPEDSDIQFVGVDINTWFGAVLAALDSFLSATNAAPTFVLDQLLTAAPEEDGLLSRLLRHKRTLADVISGTVEPVLATDSDKPDAKAAAAEKLRQALLNQLAPAFAVTAVVVFPVANAGTHRPRPPGTSAPPRLFGQPLVSGGKAAGEQDFTLSTGRIELNDGDGKDMRWLAFLFNSKNVLFADQQAFVPLNLRFALTHLEHDIRPVPGIDRYEQSTWIGFVNGPFTEHLEGERPVNIPVVLRALPRPPTLGLQTMTAGEGLVQWNFAYDYVYQAAAQDSFASTVIFNKDKSGIAAASDDRQQKLFEALARFVTAYPTIDADIRRTLPKIDGNSNKDDEAVKIAARAVGDFEGIVKDVTAAYKDWARPLPEVMAEVSRANTTRITFAFRVVLVRDNDGFARVDVSKLRLDPEGASVPHPVVLIEPDRYKAVKVEPPRGLVSYRYVDNNGEVLCHEEALRHPQRTIQMNGLSVLGFQNAQASVQVERNEALVPHVDTNKVFRFRTPEVRFPDPLVPQLSHAELDLRTFGGAPGLGSYLDHFFMKLFAGAAGQPLTIQMECAFSYRLARDIPATRLALALLPPTSFKVEDGKPPLFSRRVAEKVTSWMSAAKPVVNESSRVQFTLDLFAGSSHAEGQRMPLLSVRELFLSAKLLSGEADDTEGG